MKKKYDVAVIGAGPIGSYTAYQLCDKGFAVCVLDEKVNIGADVICTGIISKEAFKRYDLPTKSILSRIDSFVFISPYGQRLEYINPNVFAYIVKRESFDKSLLDLAKKCGADIYLGQQVMKIEGSTDYYTLFCPRKKYYARAVILATGVNYRLHKTVGLGTPPGFLSGSQIELSSSIPNQPSRIEIHIGRSFAPGSFGWVVPTDGHSSKIGLIIDKDAALGLEHMLKDRLHIPLSDFDRARLRQKPIAFGLVRKSVKDYILAVGEAAGQVKTTTGGGIFYGLLCSEIAVDRLARTLKSGSDLRDYELTWHSALVSELEIGLQLRKAARNIDDPTVERLFSFVKNNRFWIELLRPRINFDFHSNLLYFCLKSFEAILKR